MKKHQSGFSTVVILLVLAGVGLIAGVGWYVWNKSNNSKDNNSVTTENVQNKYDALIKDDFAFYGDESLVLKYPQKWTQYIRADQPEWIFFKSHDYEPATELGPSTKAGYLLEVSRSKSLDNESYEEDFKNAPLAQEAHGGSYESIQIDGHNAVLSNTKTHGTYWYAKVYLNNKTYLFRLNAPDENKPEVKELFKAILSTVKVR
jgi:hypothetical protein